MAKNTTSKKATQQALSDAEMAALTQATEKAAGAIDLDAGDLMILNAAADMHQDSDEDLVQDLVQDLVEDQNDNQDRPQDFAGVLAMITEEQANMQAQALVAAFADRAAYEQEKNAENFNIQKTLSRMQARMTTPGVVRASVAAGLPAQFLNTSESVNTRRNVYALEKVADFLYAAVTGHMKNAINRAVMASMVTIEGKLPFTGLVAKACASDKVGIETNYKAVLTRHTVSESTASTQASSTMTALEDLGVVVNKGTRSHPVYEFVETALTARLREIGLKILAGAA